MRARRAAQDPGPGPSATPAFRREQGREVAASPRAKPADSGNDVSVETQPAPATTPPAVDRHDMAQDVARAVAAEKEDGLGDVGAVGDAARGNALQHGLLVEPAGPQILEHSVGRDMAGRDGVDAQAPARPFDRHRPGQALERGLRRRIEREPRRGPSGGDAADVDDRPAPPVCERRTRERPRCVERSDGVDGEKPRRLRRIRVDQRQNGEQRRIVDEEVDRAKAPDRLRDHPLAVGGLRHVGGDGEDPRPAFGLDRRRRADEVSRLRPAIATRAP